jgi:hypothetical protein
MFYTHLTEKERYVISHLNQQNLVCEKSIAAQAVTTREFYVRSNETVRHILPMQCIGTTLRNLLQINAGTKPDLRQKLLPQKRGRGGDKPP